MTTRNRILSALLAAAFLYMMLSSAFYIAAEADHDCAGEGCPICYQISVCESTLKSAGPAVVAVPLVASIVIFAFFMPPLVKGPADNTSLVALKVKLSD